MTEWSWLKKASSITEVKPPWTFDTRPVSISGERVLGQLTNRHNSLLSEQDSRFARLSSEQRSFLLDVAKFVSQAVIADKGSAREALAIGANVLEAINGPSMEVQAGG